MVKPKHNLTWWKNRLRGHQCWRYVVRRKGSSDWYYSEFFNYGFIQYYLKAQVYKDICYAQRFDLDTLFIEYDPSKAPRHTKPPKIEEWSK